METNVVEQEWYNLSTAQTATLLETDLQGGLSEGEAARRLATYGPNELRETPPRSIWSLFVSQVKEVLVLMLIGAAAISAAVGEWKDAVVILLIVVVNAALGVFQEHRAEQAMRALKQLSKPTAKLLRDGKATQIPSAEVVPGDIALVEAGDYIPADIRLLETASLKVNESALTGESVPADKHVGPVAPGTGNGAPSGSRPGKAGGRAITHLALGDQHNLAFMGTVATYGRGRGIVIRTGMQTELGRVAQLIQEAPQEATPLQQRLEQLGKTLGLVAVALVGVVFLTGISRGEPLFEMFMTAISLAVAAVPEGLPAVVTIVLALGVQRMSRQRAIIRKLPAVETLGAATVICSDKTGTLTKNEMTVVAGYVDGQSFRVSAQGLEDAPASALALLRAGALASDARLNGDDLDNGNGPSANSPRVIGDPTEGALLIAALRSGQDPRQLVAALPRVAEVPFDSARKMMSTIHRWPGDGLLPVAGEFVAFSKGAPDVLLARCSTVYVGGSVVALEEEQRQELSAANARLASEGLRVLALAYRGWPQVPEDLDSGTVEQGLTFLGFLAMQDPPRAEAKEAVRESVSAGVRTVMITGDHRDTALAIARDLNIWRPGDKVLTGVELESITDAELSDIVEQVTVYARVSPEHKLRIVSALKARNHIVAMTGDGVNDAPALRRADIGVAMGITGTDVAKEAADMVVADDNFATIIAAIAAGRTVFANIRKAVHYLLSCNAGEIGAIFLTIAFGLGRPLTAIQILWLNLVTDGAPALALGVEPAEKGVMQEPPRPTGEGVLGGGLGHTILWQGSFLAILTVLAYWITLRRGAPPVEARTVAFLTLSLSQITHALNVRSRSESVFRLGLASNRALVGAIALSFTLQVAVVLVPPLRPVFDTVSLPVNDWLWVIALSLAPLPVVELVKAVQRSKARAATH